MTTEQKTHIFFLLNLNLLVGLMNVLYKYSWAKPTSYATKLHLYYDFEILLEGANEKSGAQFSN